MDLYGNLWERNHTPAMVHARAERRAAKLTAFREIGEWAQEEQGPGMPIGRQHPGYAAVLAVRGKLAEFNLPVVELHYGGIERKTGRGPHAINDGEILVQGMVKTPLGHSVHFDVPIQVRGGRLQAPVMLLDHGHPRVLAQSTFDDMMDRGTMHMAVPERPTMFSPPPDQRRPAKQVPIVRPGLFGLAPLSRGLTANLVKFALHGWMPAGAESYLDEAERPLDPQGPQIGDGVKLSKGCDVVLRDGQRWHLPKGTTGQVQNNAGAFGVAKAWVFFPELGATLDVPWEALSRS